MTDKYPKLTIDNVNYWYWECDPAWSMQDIANAIGCGETTVYYFMKRHNIKTRDHSESRIEVYKCKHKKDAILKGMHTNEYRNKKKTQSTNLWKDPRYRKKTIESNINSWTNVRREQNKKHLERFRNKTDFNLTDVKRKYLIEEKTIADIAMAYNCTVDPVYKFMQKSNIPKIGKTQKKILNLLYQYESINIIRLIKLMESKHNVKRNTTYHTIRKLLNKELINRSKEFGDGKAEISMTQKGRNLYSY